MERESFWFARTISNIVKWSLIGYNDHNYVETSFVWNIIQCNTGMKNNSSIALSIERQSSEYNITKSYLFLNI